MKVKGHFDHSQELYIRPRSFIDSKQKTSNAGRPQMGAFVVTPFVLADSGLVSVSKQQLYFSLF